MTSFSSTGIFHHCYPELSSKDTAVVEKENKGNRQNLGSVLSRCESEQGVLVVPARCSQFHTLLLPCSPAPVVSQPSVDVFQIPRPTSHSALLLLMG